MANSIMYLQQANAVSEGLNLFPPGKSWLSRALLCSGTPVKGLPDGHGLSNAEASGRFFFNLLFLFVYIHFFFVITINH